jgi:hypothetical protein
MASSFFHTAAASDLHAQRILNFCAHKVMSLPAITRLPAGSRRVETGYSSIATKLKTIKTEKETNGETK